MQIKEFIKNKVLKARLDEASVLVVYDEQKRYKELCKELKYDFLEIIDCSESSILSREEGYRALQKLGDSKSNLNHLLIYVPTNVPTSQKEKLNDPYWVFAEMGEVFPHPQHDGDSYLSLCLKAKPEYAAEVQRVFSENESPAFEVIDAIGGGKEWPTLRSLLDEESVTEIILAILKPSEEQKEALQESKTWINELNKLLKDAFDYSLKTEVQHWEHISDELWRFMLYSELALSLTAEEPEALKSIPRAPREAKPLISKICENLRQDKRKRGLYIRKSEDIEEDYNLESNLSGISESVTSYTFPFEERKKLKKAIQALLDSDLDQAISILNDQKQSIWSDLGENQIEWQIVRSAYSVLRECGDRKRDYKEHCHSLNELFDYYIYTFREADKVQREFEQSWADYRNRDEALLSLAKHTRDVYRSLIEDVQVKFMNLVHKEGWPVADKKFNADVFDQQVAPKVEKSGYRVAYIMADALRYELAEILEQNLKSYGSVELEASCAQLPTVTPVGMASLLPKAGSNLNIDIIDGALSVKIEGEKINRVPKRMAAFEKRFGARFCEMPINDFIKKRKKVPKETELLVLRSMEIDSHLESNPETTLKLIPDSLLNIQSAVNLLRDKGFKEVHIVSDHGFFLNYHAGPGDVCKKPNGNWTMVHDRMMLGDGDEDEQNIVMPSEKAGVKGNFPKIAAPRSMAPYKAGELFFHGGLSLQEAIVPVLSVMLKEEEATEQQFDVNLTYRGGLEKINSRIPVFNLEVGKRELFFEEDLELKVIAKDKEGNVVGEPQPGGAVNPGSGLVTINPGDSEKVVVRMQEDFEGDFQVIVMDPNTDVTYATLSLETDYMV